MSDDDRPQHMRALEYANEIRLARAQLRRQIFDREVKAKDVIEAPIPPYLVNLPLATFLRWQYRWGKRRTEKLCARLGISGKRRLGALTMRQRAALVDALD